MLEGLKKAIDASVARGEKPGNAVGLYKTALARYKAQYAPKVVQEEKDPIKTV